MLDEGDCVVPFTLPSLDSEGTQVVFEGKLILLVFIETDCPTCRLTLPYLEKLAVSLHGSSASVFCISQDGDDATRRLISDISVDLQVLLDSELIVSRQYNPPFVPALYLIDRNARIIRKGIGFEKKTLNELSAELSSFAGSPLVVFDYDDGTPASKPGCVSRHLEPAVTGDMATPVDLHAKRGRRASVIELPDDVDPYDYCVRADFSDPLPVIPPTRARVDRMLEIAPGSADEIVGLVPPNYGAATIEKIAANAVMAGCFPELIRVLVSVIRAACDERLNLHGVQATTHFAAPLVLINGPVRQNLGFASGSNVFSNVARANSTLGRALQLVLINLGGARPGEIDTSTLGNPGKFSFCIAENEEESPWEPFHIDRGYEENLSTVTLFAAEPPRGISEHQARHGRSILETISKTLATIWSYRVCFGQEALVIICPEHAVTLARDGFTKQLVREFLFENTGVPVRTYDNADGEGVQQATRYDRVEIQGEPCYRKFETPEAIRVIVAGGAAGKFSAVIGGWRGSVPVTYPIG